MSSALNNFDWLQHFKKMSFSENFAENCIQPSTIRSLEDPDADDFVTT